jgi:hypothetical protein
MQSQELLNLLKSLNLPTNDYAVFGSGPMYPRGIKELGHDIDLIVRGSAWDKAQTIGEVNQTKLGGNKVIELFDGNIEIFNGWAPGEWSVDELIDTSETFDGIPYVTLENVLKWKKIMNREKDIEHIRLIEEYLESHE